eukprot:gene551-1208_t
MQMLVNGEVVAIELGEIEAQTDKENSEIQTKENGLSSEDQQHHEDEDPDDYPSQGICAPLDKVLTFIETIFKTFYFKNSSLVKMVAGGILCGGYVAYFLVACWKDFKRARDLFAVTMFALFCFLYWLVKKFFGEKIDKYVITPVVKAIKSKWKFVKWGCILVVFILLILWIALDTAKNPKRLISLAGLVIYVLLAYIFSKNRKRVVWRPVLWGLALQFVFGILILRTTAGRQFFKWLGDRVSIFLAFSDTGAQFLFGKTTYTAHFFAFKVLPVVVFFSAFVYMVYYLGIMQVVIKKIAWVMQVTMGTSAAESLNAAGNIFIGQTEAPLLIRPFLPDLTKSEIHAVMTGGFATIAGSVLGAYILIGVSASHLLSASVMSAPAALAISKLMYPETTTPKTKKVSDIHIEKGNEKNFLEALAAGASMSIALVANISVMLIAFLSVLAFLDAILCWLGSMVGYCISFEWICSYVLMPFAYIMGVSWKDSFEVAKLLGLKTFLNEFVAYESLAKLIKNRRQNLAGTQLELRSETVATYALCGFANIGSIGVQIGGLSALAPKRRSDLASVAFRALLAGTIACFMTACIAGILYEDGFDDSRIPVV